MIPYISILQLFMWLRDTQILQLNGKKYKLFDFLYQLNVSTYFFPWRSLSKDCHLIFKSKVLKKNGKSFHSSGYTDLHRCPFQQLHFFLLMFAEEQITLQWHSVKIILSDAFT